MKHNIASLFEFIDMAEHNRNYAPATARGYRAALKLFENESNDDERASTEVFKSRIEQIYRQVFAKNSKEFKATSLQVYKSRVLKIISDYEKYGVDPTKLASWTSTAVVHGPRKENVKKDKKVAKGNDESEDIEGDLNDLKQGGIRRAELPLGNANFVMLVPKDYTPEDVKKIKQFVTLVLGE